jgi:hypothetical protein
MHLLKNVKMIKVKSYGNLTYWEPYAFINYVTSVYR